MHFFCSWRVAKPINPFGIVQFHVMCASVGKHTVMKCKVLMAEVILARGQLGARQAQAIGLAALRWGWQAANRLQSDDSDISQVGLTWLSYFWRWLSCRPVGLLVGKIWLRHIFSAFFSNFSSSQFFLYSIAWSSYFCRWLSHSLCLRHSCEIRHIIDTWQIHRRLMERRERCGTFLRNIQCIRCIRILVLKTT